MKGVFFERHGALDELRYGEMPDPVPGAGQVLLAIRAVALNGFDPMILRGIPGLRTPLPHTPGADLAGEIVAHGAGVDAARWPAGARVTVMPHRPGVGMMGETLRGAASELFAVDADWLLPVPDGVSDVEAAALPTAYGTALRLIATRGAVAAGEKVLILGAAGGVGTCCVQLAKRCGAIVIATTRSAEKARKLAALGADHVIDTSQEDFVPAIHRMFGKPRIYGGGGVDAVVNYVGGATWVPSLKVVRAGGRILTCGATSGYDPQTDIRYIWSFEIDIRGCNAWTEGDLEQLLDMVSHREIVPAIHGVFRFAEIREAMRQVADSEVFGKLILVP